MTRQHLFVGALLSLSFLVGCTWRKAEPLVIVRVFRDPSAQVNGPLTRATNQFTLTKPHLATGQGVMIATYESRSYKEDLQRLEAVHPQLVILNSQSDISDNATVSQNLGNPEFVCDGKAAYVPTWVSAPEREASEIYLRFLRSHCE